MLSILFLIPCIPCQFAYMINLFQKRYKIKGAWALFSSSNHLSGGGRTAGARPKTGRVARPVKLRFAHPKGFNGASELQQERFLPFAGLSTSPGPPTLFCARRAFLPDSSCVRSGRIKDSAVWRLDQGALLQICARVKAN
jgi:hypothetical protein